MFISLLFRLFIHYKLFIVPVPHSVIFPFPSHISIFVWICLPNLRGRNACGCQIEHPLHLPNESLWDVSRELWLNWAASLNTSIKNCRIWVCCPGSGPKGVSPTSVVTGCGPWAELFKELLLLFVSFPFFLLPQGTWILILFSEPLSLTELLCYD